MKSWSISKRFTLSIIVFTIPLVTAIYLLIQFSTEQLAFSEKERQGQILLSKIHTTKVQLFKSHFKHLGNNEAWSSQERADIQKNWHGLSSELSNINTDDFQKSLETYFEASPESRGSAFVNLLIKLHLVERNISDKFNLVLDTDLDSFYLMDSLVNLLPKLNITYATIAMWVSASDEKTITIKREEFENNIPLFEATLNQLKENLEKSQKNDPISYGATESFQKNYDSYQENIQKQLEQLKALNTDESLINRNKTFLLLASLSDQNLELSAKMNSDFETMLNSRIQSLKIDHNKRLTLFLGTMIAALLLSAFLGFTIQKTINTFRTAVSKLRSDAQFALDVGQNLIQTSDNVSKSSSTQAAAIEETSASLEELSSMVAINADNSQKARQLATEAHRQASQGEVEMQDLISSMNEISTSSKQIEEIMKIIDDIAFQTNLLALNASVEAARAGEHGKGFAVVADAVRALAQKSADSAKEIGVLISDSMVKIENGKNSVDRNGAAMQSLLKSIESVSTLNGEIAHASQEQTTGLQQIAKAIGELERTTIENSSVAQKSSEFSNKSLSQAEGLLRVVDILDSELRGGHKSEDSDTKEFNFQEAIQAHLKWKGRLKNYIEKISNEKLDHNIICKDNQCPLGKWIHGSGQKHQHLPAFSVLKKEHALFHVAAGEIVKAVQLNDPKASHLLREGSEFDLRTKATVQALQEMDRKIS